jgi:hypothetical protein
MAKEGLLTKKQILETGFLKNQSLRNSVKYELLFVIKKFFELSVDSQLLLYKKINSDYKSVRTEAVSQLVDFVISNSKEMAESVSEAFDDWVFVDDGGQKTLYIFMYFFCYLEKDESNNLTILYP